MESKESLGSYLKHQREKLGLSQQEISEALGYSSPQFVSNWERDVSTPPVKSVKKIAEVYKLDTRKFIQRVMDHVHDQTMSRMA